MRETTLQTPRSVKKKGRSCAGADTLADHTENNGKTGCILATQWKTIMKQIFTLQPMEAAAGVLFIEKKKNNNN